MTAHQRNPAGKAPRVTIRMARAQGDNRDECKDGCCIVGSTPAAMKGGKMGIQLPTAYRHSQLLSNNARPLVLREGGFPLESREARVITLDAFFH